MSALSKVAKMLAKAAEKGLDVSPQARKARAVEQGYLTPRKMKELTDNPKIDIVPTNRENDVEAHLLINNYEIGGGPEDFLRNYPQDIIDGYFPYTVQANGLKRPAYTRMFSSKITHPDFDMDAPMTFYHGTAGDISTFNPNYLGRTTDAASASHGTFLSNLPEDANDYAKFAEHKNPKEQRSLDIISRLNDEIRNAEKHKELFTRYNMADNGGDPKFIEKQEDYIERLLNRMRIVERGLGSDNYSAVYPVHVRPENPMFVDKQGGSYGDITKKLVKAKNAGHDSVIFFDIKDPNPGATHITMFEPEKIRSINAMFDPERINSRDLLAGIGGLSALGLTDESLQQEPQEYAGGGLVAKKGVAALKELLENLHKVHPERMKRAEEAGFDTSKILVRGTPDPSLDFSDFSHFTDDPSIADLYSTGYHTNYMGGHQETLFPAFGKKNIKEFDLSDRPDFIEDVSHIYSKLAHDNSYIMKNIIDEAPTKDIYSNHELDLDDMINLRRQNQYVLKRGDARSIFNDFTPESLADEKFASGGLVKAGKKVVESIIKDGVEFIKNPTKKEIKQLIEEDPYASARVMRDEEGNVYAFHGNEMLHDEAARLFNVPYDIENPLESSDVIGLYKGKLHALSAPYEDIPHDEWEDWNRRALEMFNLKPAIAIGAGLPALNSISEQYPYE